MSDSKIYDVPGAFAQNAHLNETQFQELYEQSIADPEGFWSEQAENYISWFKPWDSVSNWSFGEDVHIKWFEVGCTLG